MRTLIIGDVHGCFDELQALLAAAGIGADDLVILLGDVVDRGPATGAVIGLCRTRRNTVVVMGNHERKHVRWSRGEVTPAPSQRITRRELGDVAQADAVAWMAGLPTFSNQPEALVVHAMMEPGVPVEEQRENVIVGTLSGESYLRNRYVRPWYELYDGALPVVVGHHDISGRGEPYVRADQMVYGVDTNCCRGGKLTGLLLPEFRLVSVPAREDHWQRQQAKHRDLWEARRPSDGSLTFAQLTTLLADRSARAELEPGQEERMRRLLDEGREATEQLALAARRAHLELLARIGASGFRKLSPEEQGRRYAAAIQDKRLAPLMHACRKGDDPLARARLVFRPAKAVALATELGLVERRWC